MNLLKKLARKIIPAGLLKILEKVYRQGRGFFWQAACGFPARHAKVIAVTGTNGKTTTCAFINEVLKAAGYKTAVLTTVFYEFDGKKVPNKTHFTIDKQSIVQRFFARAKKAGADWAVLEVTSHALDQGRIMGVPVEIAVITNLSQEHLDYHGTMEEYASAKARLLRDYGAQYAVLNADDEWFGFFQARSKAETVSYGKTEQSDIHIGRVNTTPRGIEATIGGREGKFKITAKLIGEFNAHNAAAAASAGQILGIKNKVIASGISSLGRLEGRMEPIDAGQDFTVLVDFAITPEAIGEALKSLQKTTKGKVRIVFGATGDRDKDKRPKMGHTAAKYADAIYLTDDETYTEDPDTIRQAVYAGIKAAKAASKARVINDREEAIRQALKDSGKGDSVLIAGLGHEDSRNMGGQLVAWSDQKTARKILRTMA